MGNYAKEQVREQVIAYLDHHGIRYMERPEVRSIKIVFAGKDKMGDTYLDFFFLEDCVMVMGHYQTKIPPESRRTVMEYLNAVNKKAVDGYFFIDMQDGMVLYQNKVKLLDREYVAEETGAYLFVTAFTTCTRYEKGCEQVMDGMLTPEEAFEMAEAQKL